MKFENLKITAYLGTEVITDGYCPLDAKIYYHFCRNKFGVQHRTRSLASNIDESSNIQLPILKVNHKKKDWFYACSFAQWSANSKYGKSVKARRFAIDKAVKYIEKPKKVELRKGQFKNYFIEEYTISAHSVVWYLVANKQEIQRYLPFITHIGKKSSGMVLRWKVEQFHSDWSVRGEKSKEHPKGKLLRAVPISKSRSPIVYGIRPSYWLPKHQVNVVLPKVAI